MFKSVINRLSDDIIAELNSSASLNKPSFILRALLENSLDAMSSDIIIHINNLGFDLIRIIDNGIGIYKDDLCKIGVRYNTSKISSVSDLKNLKTYGFKGESLFFFRSCSDLNVISKPFDQIHAYKIYFNKQIEKGFFVVPFSGVNGTVVEIKNLFYNNLSLKKFFLNSLEEEENLFYVFSSLSLSKFKTRFVFFYNGIELVNLPVCKDNYSKKKRLEVVNNLFKFSKWDDFFDISFFKEDVSFYGNCYLSFSKKNVRTFNFFFVNDRNVKSSIIDSIFNDIIKINKKNFTFSYCFYLYLNNFQYNMFYNLDNCDIIFKEYNELYKLLFDLIYKKILDKSKFISNIKVIENYKNILDDKLSLDKYICINSKNRKVFNSKIYFLSANGVLFFVLNSNFFYVKLNAIRNKVLAKLFSSQFFKRKKLISKSFSFFDFFLNYDFLKFKNVLFLYGFDFEIINSECIKLSSIPGLLYNLDVNWINLFKELKIFLEKNFFFDIFSNRFDINIINIIINNVDECSPCNNYELKFFNDEINFSSLYDVGWFNKNCYSIKIK